MILNAFDIYYNEFDPYAAQWLRNLIAMGIIAPGVVDERSIVDVKPEDIRGFKQCHFFAGIGVWSFALRRAGWADDRHVWTASCPCQPFSAAGAGAGFADQRHLWPHLHWLIEQCGPAAVLGEQVASKDAEPWLDLVQLDLEKLGYAFGAVPFPSAGVGAPHIRDRLYWVANAQGERWDGRQGSTGAGGRLSAQACSSPIRLAHTNGRNASAERQQRSGRWPGQAGDGRDAARVEPQRLRDADRLAYADAPGRGTGGRGGLHSERQAGALVELGGGAAGVPRIEQPGPTNGYWRAADWLGCRDGKWRPVEPGAFPLVNGPASRVGRSGADWRTAAGEEGKGHRAGRLKGYGNAINAEAARVFIECVMESL